MTDPSQRPQFRILSLDGGGILGAFAASFLAEIERRKQCRIADYFDLIAGTSTGGIIAAALAAGEPASRVVEFYRDRGPRIFRRKKFGSTWERWARIVNRPLRRWLGLDLQSLLMPTYDNRELADALTEVFGERTIESLTATRLVMPAVDLIQGKTVVFKTPHLPDLIRDRHYLVREAVLATTAAPTFFQPTSIRGTGAYADGGVWANNPTMVAVTEALKIAEVGRRENDPCHTLHDIHCLSVGTGDGPYAAFPGGSAAGIGWWLTNKRIFTVMMASQAQGVHFQAQYLLGERYHRANYTVPDVSWTLDNTANLDQLIHLGTSHASERLASLIPSFFERMTEPYRPFPDSSAGR